MQKPGRGLNDTSVAITATCAVMFVLITLFGLYNVKHVRKDDFNKAKPTKNLNAIEFRITFIDYIEQ